jgi:outer membrane protein insertion porin family
VDEAKRTLGLDIDIDEGKPFYVARIEFTGNTITRDKVIRRELLLEEGQVYNSRLWELSLLRLNQLNYFDALKVDQDSEVKQNQADNTVDLLLKLKEKGKNQIGLNGGVSGLSGAFVGANYQTNNFLGLGETLSLQANIGDLSRTFSFGFQEPYFNDRPLALGFQVYTSKYDYNQAKNYQNLTGQSLNLSAAQYALIQNYNQETTGFNVTLGYPIRRTFKRVGLTYNFSNSTIQAFSPASLRLFQTLAYRGATSQNALNGIYTSTVTPSFLYSTIDNPFRPHGGKSFSAGVQFAGVGGNVRYIEPVIEFKQWKPISGLRFRKDGRNMFGYRFQFSYVTGYGGDVAPPFNRFYGGGESDVRGFDIRSITPYSFIGNKVLFNLTNPDGTLVPKNPTQPGLGPVQVPIPVYNIVSVGGDTSFTTNLEYRIPIAGPVQIALFDDFNLNGAIKDSELRETDEGLATLESTLYGCPILTNGTCKGGRPETFNPTLSPFGGTNFVPRMSTGAELSIIVPVVNAPFRIYYAYNPLRVYETISGGCSGTTGLPADKIAPCLLSRSLFPAGGAGDYTYAQAVSLYGSTFYIHEPRKTFRFTISTTF